MGGDTDLLQDDRLRLDLTDLLAQDPRNNEF